ncbi:MAG: HPr family phosphocarrier protein [Oscillospiraceae bacterium]|nr:HPr family phosphocarrier protein [Oscillospiraceae bacterium]
MRSVYVSFSKVNDVKRFIEKISPLDGDFDLIDGMYVIDAKSLMGILAMDLTKPIELRIQKDNDNVMQAISDFVVDLEDGNGRSK